MENKIDTLEKVKRELVINKLEKETSINFSEHSINRLHILFNEYKNNPDIIKSMSKSNVSLSIFKRAIALYEEN